MQHFCIFKVYSVNLDLFTNYQDHNYLNVKKRKHGIHKSLFYDKKSRKLNVSIIVGKIYTRIYRQYYIHNVII